MFIHAPQRIQRNISSKSPPKIPERRLSMMMMCNSSGPSASPSRAGPVIMEK